MNKNLHYFLCVHFHIFSPSQAPEIPEFEDKFQDQTVETEGTIRLVAKIHGIPAPDVTWSR